MRKCGEGADQDWGVVYMSGCAGWGQRRVMARLSPSGAALEVGMGVTAAGVANAIVSLREELISIHSGGLSAHTDSGRCGG